MGADVRIRAAILGAGTAPGGPSFLRGPPRLADVPRYVSRVMSIRNLAVAAEVRALAPRRSMTSM